MGRTDEFGVAGWSLLHTRRKDLPVATSLYHATASLDGFITGPGEELSWLLDPTMGGPNAIVDTVIANIGALLVGGRTAHWQPPGAQPDDIEELTGKPFGGAWEGPIVIHTHDPEEAPASEDHVHVTGTVEEAYAVAAEAAGDKYVVVLGAVTSRRLLEAGLLDEVLLHVVPRFVGDGTRVLEAPGGLPVALEWLDRSTSGDVQNLWARVVR
ncbi:dihydrofolate reductase family protein [Mumia sp. Pv 4-285]|uniref:dihydrofolate reductase family protein n=1 Tax=Mumia qirimensis TaxID=3234852 RepID=UPI00351D9A3C